jgi:hypothetical protein
LYRTARTAASVSRAAVETKNPLLACPEEGIGDRLPSWGRRGSTDSAAYD